MTAPTLIGAGRRALPAGVLARGGGGVAAVVVGLVVLRQLALHHVYSFSTPLPYVVLGAVIGMTYGLLGVGLVLIYRTNRIINFAHGQIGAFGAAVFGVVVVKYHVPYWLFLPVALALAGLVGAAAEAGVVRRLRDAPRLVSIVATLGVGQFLVAFAAAFNSTSAGSLYPQPPFTPVFSIGALLVTHAYFGMLVLSPVAVLGVGAFLRYSRTGIALRGAAANPEAARMAGIFAGRMSTLAWAIGGALSAFSAILTQPTQGFTSADSFGPSLLLRALTCAVVARMSSLPRAFATGIGLGVLEQLLSLNYPRSSGLVTVVLFVAILVALLLQRRTTGRDQEKGSWAAVQALKPIPQAAQSIWLVRNLGRLTALAALGVACLLPLVISNAVAVDFSRIFAFSIVGLSIGLLTGLGGQLTLGQFAVASVGAVVSYQVSSRTGDFTLAITYAGLAAGIVSVLVGLPALRIKGLMLTVTTLSFALATQSWLLAQPWMLGRGHDPGAPIVFGTPLDTGRRYYWFALALLVAATLLTRNLRSSGLGRLLRSVRDNEDNARAFTVSATAIKLKGYLLAGFIAGVGGAVYGHSLSNISTTDFPVTASIAVVVMTVLGGVSTLGGPILGALYVIGVPLLPLDSAGIAATQFGSLLLILFFPGGLSAALGRQRDRLVAVLARRHGIELDSPVEVVSVSAGPAPARSAPPAATARPSTTARPATTTGAGVLLEARHLVKHFGGVKAVDGVSFQVRAGQTVGLIGPNGAGKTTTFELLGGFTLPDRGSVTFDRRDVTSLPPEARARLGLIRSFQDAALFPTMTVLETVQVAYERRDPTGLVAPITGMPFAERTKQRRAREIIATMGLDRYRDSQVQELSTGTRRITELACLVALEPTLLLLDEPSSGIAQRETEALGLLLGRLKAELGLTLVVIEHDIPLIMGISDTIVAMADGKVICAGPPHVVRADARVVDSYLGGSITAIERSGATPAPRRVPAGARR